MSADSKRYEGWENYETWCVHLWLSNDEGSYQYWREEAVRCLRDATKEEEVKAGLWTKAEAARFMLGEAMKESFETFHPFHGEHLEKPREPDVYADLLNAALSEVDWSEIAEAFLEDLVSQVPDPSDKEEEESGEDDQGEESKRPLFSLGRVVSTPGALAALTREDIEAALRRHISGDWGEVSEADRAENDLSVREGFRILSAYRGRNGCRFWVITEADRSATTVLLPEEY